MAGETDAWIARKESVLRGRMEEKGRGRAAVLKLWVTGNSEFQYPYRHYLKPS